MPTAAIYTRISTEDQSTYSLSSQVQDCRELAMREGYTVRDDTIFQDDGYSSHTLRRPGLDAVRDLVRSKTIDAVIVHDPDRWVRGAGLHYLLDEELNRSGVKLLFCSYTRADNPEGRLFDTMRAAISEYELHKIRERGRRGQRARAKDNLPLLGRCVPLGYRYLPISRTSRGELEVDPIESELVREIFSLRLQGLGSWRIAKILTLREVKTKRGSQVWSPKVVVGILSNTAYVGKLFYGKHHHEEPTDRRKPINLKNPRTTLRKNPKEQWIEIQVPAIIDQATFDAIQKSLSHSKEANPRRRKREYMFLGGRLRCVCGRSMGGYHDSRSDRRRYKCARREAPSCHRSIDAEWIEAQGWEIVEALMENEPEYLSMEFKRRYQPTANCYSRNDLDVIEKGIQEAERKLQRWKDAYASGVISLPEYAELKIGIDQETSNLSKLRVEIQEALERQQRHEDEIQSAIEFIHKVHDEFRTYTLTEKRRVVEMLDLRIVYEDREHWHPMFYLPAEWGLDPKEVFGNISIPTSYRSHWSSSPSLVCPTGCLAVQG